jgi:hypothetical protein
MQLELFEKHEPKSETYIRGPRVVRKFSSLKAGVPRLVIEGKWLTKLGVKVGDPVAIKYSQDSIVISWKSNDHFTL